jgi:hypothetical protein
LNFSGWLEPMLNRIAIDWSYVATPIIDVLNDNNFELSYTNAEDVQIGSFKLQNLIFGWAYPSEDIRNMQASVIDPLR